MVRWLATQLAGDSIGQHAFRTSLAFGCVARSFVRRGAPESRRPQRRGDRACTRLRLMKLAGIEPTASSPGLRLPELRATISERFGCGRS